MDTTTPTTEPITPQETPQPEPVIQPTKPPIIDTPKPTQSSIYPELIVYALMVYSFYFAAKHTREALLSKDPTARGLFKVVPLQYKVTLTDLDSSEREGISADIDPAMLRLAFGDDLGSEMTTALDESDEPTEKPIEETDAQADKEGQDLGV